MINGAQIKTLEDTQAAILNILEDLEISRDRLLEEKAKDEAIIESIGEGIIAVDQIGKIILLNKQATVILGWQANDLMGQRISNILKIEDEKGSPLALSIDKKISIHCVFYANNQKKIPIGLTVSPIIQNGKNEGMILVFRDITREKEIDRMKTEFISLASHQLRTPLSAIRWSSEILINHDFGQLNEEQAKLIRNVYLSTRRMIDLVNALLNVSLLEGGGILVELRMVNIKELVEEIVRELQERYRNKKINLKINIDPQLPPIKIDPKLLRQIFLNLLNNAIKYTPESGKISVSAQKEKDRLIAKVQDTGYGIPESEKSRIFQKFYRGSNVLKVDTDGSGLGLYFVKSIIDSLKGKIGFESAENKGTTFWFSLPIET